MIGNTEIGEYLSAQWFVVCKMFFYDFTLFEGANEFKLHQSQLTILTANHITLPTTNHISLPTTNHSTNQSITSFVWISKRYFPFLLWITARQRSKHEQEFFLKSNYRKVLICENKTEFSLCLKSCKRRIIIIEISLRLKSCELKGELKCLSCSAKSRGRINIYRDWKEFFSMGTQILLVSTTLDLCARKSWKVNLVHISERGFIWAVLFCLDHALFTPLEVNKS